MLKSNFSLKDFDFELPDELIAQYPIENRDESRLFVLNRKNNEYRHTYFEKITEELQEGDCLVFNNARVIRARIYCTRESGGKLEIILTNKINNCSWQALTNRKKRLQVGETVSAIGDKAVRFTITDKEDDFILIQSNVALTDDVLERIGLIPLPPYIKRDSGDIDSIRYQTVYAEKSGAVAAPTAGLHFTNSLLQSIEDMGVHLVYCTLNVSWGTFQPVRTNELHEHKMHTESFELSQQAAETVNTARKRGNRIIAVGTTSLRVLESTFSNGSNIPSEDSTDIFIYPPYQIKSINGLITNFHTPQSTLLMLVSAFAGYETIMDAYKTAVRLKYRFFSYGDSMIIL
jgi:S-adenosylmethionine:tRNA ribosyltransferase-isomerase